MTMQRTSYRSIPAGDLPEGLVLFDGVCVLCSGWVKFTIPRDEARRFRFAAIQGGYGRSIAERLGIDPDEPGTNAVVSNGYVHFKSDQRWLCSADCPGGVGRGFSRPFQSRCATGSTIELPAIATLCSAGTIAALCRRRRCGAVSSTATGELHRPNTAFFRFSWVRAACHLHVTREVCPPARWLWSTR